jgi:hypothetical protein
MAEPLTFPDAVGATDDCLNVALSMQEEEFKPYLMRFGMMQQWMRNAIPNSAKLLLLCRPWSLMELQSFRYCLKWHKLLRITQKAYLCHTLSDNWPMYKDWMWSGMSRGGGLRRKVLSSTLVPSNWHSFLSVDKNKEELFIKLANALEHL